MESRPFLTQRPRALCCRQNDVKFHSVLQNLRALSLLIGLQNAARVQWEDAQLWISEDEFLMNPFEPRFWETASLHNFSTVKTPGTLFLKVQSFHRPGTPRLDIRRYFYSQRVVDSWNSVPHDIKKSMSVNAFKNAYRRHKDAMFAPA